MNDRTTASWRAATLTGLAILAFAGNSLLTRQALAHHAMDPAMFAGVRLVAGAVALAVIGGIRGLSIRPGRRDLAGIVALSTYMGAFTFAYVELSAATGALILFPAVQISLTLLAAARGIMPRPIELAGMAVATGGLVLLLGPQATSASPGAAVLMLVAGFAWACYTMLGKGVTDATAQTARSFIGAVPIGLLLLAVSHGPSTFAGLLLAIASGVLASAAGYAIWYAALGQISVSAAGAAQLLVPVVAALGAFLLLNEPASPWLLASGALVLLGTAMTLLRQSPNAVPPRQPTGSGSTSEGP